MAIIPIRVIMNGVTGRMGTNQHLVRSILAIRQQGGVVTANGDRIVPEAVLVGRNADKLQRLAAAHGVEHWTTDLDSALADDARYAAGAISAALAGAPKLRASPSTGIANALDGKTSTRWSAPALGDEWVEIDFRQSRPLRRLTLDQTGRGAEFPEHYTVHVTNDPKSPGPAVAQGKGQRNKTVIELPAGAKGRYVVIKNTAERKDVPWTICELLFD